MEEPRRRTTTGLLVGAVLLLFIWWWWWVRRIRPRLALALLMSPPPARHRRPLDLHVAICCIDARADELPDCLRAVRVALDATPSIVGEVWGVFRHSDRRCASLFALSRHHVLTVADYPDPCFGLRHHYGGLASQRTLALRAARRRQRSAHDSILWFVDSDIRITPASLQHLLWGLALGADVVAVPYRVRWAQGAAHGTAQGAGVRLGYLHPRPSIEPPRGGPHSPWPYHACTVVGMGCTALAVGSPRIPQSFRVGEALGKQGEDIGFCLDVERVGGRVWCCNWTGPVEHTGL